jgi:hypothetical protein
MCSELSHHDHPRDLDQRGSGISLLPCHDGLPYQLQWHIMDQAAEENWLVRQSEFTKFEQKFNSLCV